MLSRRWGPLGLAVLLALSIPVSTMAATGHSTQTAAGAQAAPAALALTTRATNTFSNLPITGTTATGGTFRGLLDVTNFKIVNGALVAVGSLTGTVRNAAGGIVGTVVGQAVKLPVKAGSASTCDILHLKLGPLDLNLLGLMVHLNRVVLDITADAGPGNLLGNLLCAVAHLLDAGGNTTVLRDLLRSILAVLNL